MGEPADQLAGKQDPDVLFGIEPSLRGTAVLDESSATRKAIPAGLPHTPALTIEIPPLTIVDEAESFVDKRVGLPHTRAVLVTAVAGWPLRGSLQQVVNNGPSPSPYPKPSRTHGITSFCANPG